MASWFVLPVCQAGLCCAFAGNDLRRFRISLQDGGGHVVGSWMSTRPARQPPEHVFAPVAVSHVPCWGYVGEMSGWGLVGSDMPRFAGEEGPHRVFGCRADVPRQTRIGFCEQPSRQPPAHLSRCRICAGRARAACAGFVGLRGWSLAAGKGDRTRKVGKDRASEWWRMLV